MRLVSSPRIVLVTGPPNNGRDDYIKHALSELKKTAKIGYHHVFAYMQKHAPSCGVPNLQRESVFTVSKAKLDQIRDKAFSEIIKEIHNSSNDIEIVSTPSMFKTPIRVDYYNGKVEGLTTKIMKAIRPHLLVFFIDDLLRVRTRVNKDPQSQGLGLKLKDIAELRETSFQVVKDYVIDAKSTSHPIDFIIFAKEHPVSTFVDIVLGKKPRIYLSYHITGQNDFQDIQRFANKLNSSFVCIDPYAIKDWQIVKAYDKAIEESKQEVVMESKINGDASTEKLYLNETEEAIDLIRSQIVERDLEIIANVHATVVYHKGNQPSYGVMVEVFHSATVVQRPVYVLYPFKVRLSPFFEHYVKPENIIQGDRDISEMEDELVAKLKNEYRTWPTWTS